MPKMHPPISGQRLVGLRAGVEGQSRAGTVIGGQLPVMPDSLSTDMATALLSPGAAQLWAVVEEAAEGSVALPAAFGQALVAIASTIAGALFANAVANDV